MHKKELGQYFTKSEELQQYVFDKVKYKSSVLLEPSFGAGHLLKKFKEYDENYPIDCYELDSEIDTIVKFNKFQNVKYGDFLKESINKKYKTIIGNPPYVKSGSSNLYIKFIEKCYECLEDDGELIFIVPSDFTKLTSASSIIEKMSNNGKFTDFLFPHNEKLFEDANIDVMIFRYEKCSIAEFVLVNGKNMICNIISGIITFSETKLEGFVLEDRFNVYVGMVSGRDEIYKVSFGNIDILNDKDKTEKYIFTTTFPTENKTINEYLEMHKEELLSRKIKKFSESNWFEWGAPRNISSIHKYWGNNCIYIKNMTRSKEVGFRGKVQYFGGSLLCLVPKYDMEESELEGILEFINSESFKKDYIYSGRFKIGHKQISNAIIPN